MTTRPTLTRAQRHIVGIVAAGAVLLASIGFAGSYAAVRHLAERKGFGDFALVFPIGIDAGIGVLLALDLLLTWLRIPYSRLRPAAWVLTAATIAFNAAASWPDPIAVGMHAVIPVLFVAVVEAARHAVGRIADITAERHVEPVRLTRWLLAPAQTFRLWRRMRLWELRSYDEALRLERDQLVYRARLRAEYGRSWRRRAPVEQLLPLRLARYGHPVHPDAPGDETPADAQSFDAVATEAVAIAAPELAPELASDADAPDDGPRGLVLDFAPTAPWPHPDVVYRAPAIAPDAPAPATRQTRRTPAPAPDADVIEAARALAATGPMPLRRMQRELGIGQARAQRIRDALNEEAIS